MHFKILGSSSSGNCSLLSYNNSHVLIDAGFSAKRINLLLQQHNISLADLDAVFITHEHSDHVIGLKGISRAFPRIPIFANPATARAISQKLNKALNFRHFETGTPFEFKELSITPFSIPHDAQDPVGFVFKTPTTSLAWVTDLGYIPLNVQQQIAQVQHLVIESNYDVDLIDADTKRPWSIKQRIKSRHGHLSNQATFEFLSENPSPHWKNIYLAHISKDCNCLQKVTSLFKSLQNPNFSFNLHIIDPAPANI